MAGAVQVNFGRINHPEFGLLFENLIRDIKLLKFKPPAAGKAENKGVDSAYLADLHSKLMSKFRGCLPNDLDEDIAIKVQSCIDQAMSMYCPELDSVTAIEMISVRFLVEAVGHDNGSQIVIPRPGDSDDDDNDDEGEEDKAHIVLYTMASKFLRMLREVLDGAGDLEEFATSIPNLHADDISKDTVIMTMVSELLVKPEFVATTAAQRQPCTHEYMCNAQASYLAHYDYLVYNRFTAETYHGFFEPDSAAVLFVLEMRALFAGVFLDPDVRNDVLFQRMRATLAICSRILHSLHNLAYDCDNDLVIQNPLMINMSHASKKSAAEGKSAEEIRAELAGILNNWLEKLRGTLADLQVMVDVFPSVFPKDGELVKYMTLLVTGWNGTLQFYGSQQ